MFSYRVTLLTFIIISILYIIYYKWSIYEFYGNVFLLVMYLIFKECYVISYTLWITK